MLTHFKFLFILKATNFKIFETDLQNLYLNFMLLKAIVHILLKVLNNINLKF